MTGVQTCALPISRFTAVRVNVEGASGAEPDEQWLVIERPNPAEAPEHYVLSSLSKDTSLEDLVRTIKQRWRIERTYEDLKGELGLDHFEGRSYRGWQHHVSCTLACFAFVVAERARAFPPSASRAQRDLALASAA